VGDSPGDSLLLAARRRRAWLPHRSRLAFGWESGGHRCQVSQGAVRCWVTPFRRGDAGLPAMRWNKRPEPVANSYHALGNNPLPPENRSHVRSRGTLAFPGDGGDNFNMLMDFPPA
jgi:hypothetical protein